MNGLYTQFVRLVAGLHQLLTGGCKKDTSQWEKHSHVDLLTDDVVEELVFKTEQYFYSQ